MAAHVAEDLGKAFGERLVNNPIIESFNNYIFMIILYLQEIISSYCYVFNLYLFFK